VPFSINKESISNPIIRELFDRQPNSKIIQSKKKKKKNKKK
jgi:hypothetical protein